MSDVSPAERKRVVDLLTAHCGDGRLTLDELEERIGEAYAAVTADDLRRALRELPAVRREVALATATTPAPSPVPVRIRPRWSIVAWRIHLYCYLSTIAFLVAIYALADLGGYFWPMWPAMGWGFFLLGHRAISRAIWE